MNRLIYVKDFFIKYGLEILLFGVAIGNADVLHTFLTKTGSPDTVQLLIAIYCTELVIVLAGQWGVTGLFIAAIMFLTSLVSIASLYPENWLGHSYFSITIFCGTVGNYVRRQIQSSSNTRKLVDHSGNVNNLSGLSVRALRTQFGLSHNKAKKLQIMVKSGIKITVDTIKKLKGP